MNIAVIGTGYVGLVVGAGLAETGNEVVCADIDEAKIAKLQQGGIPIYEPGLEPLVARNLAEGRLSFTTDVGMAVRESDIVFIAVGTPPGEDGSADLQHVLSVAETIGENINGEKVVITKSTVPVGTAAKVRNVIESKTPKFPVHICSNPEFLKEGAAVEDFMKPDRVVVGVDSEQAKQVLEELYAPFVRNGHPIVFMDIASAEITKYAANAMLATRISFMNMIARLCDEVGADVGLVRRGIGSDERIGASFLYAGCGYGGSCFPKDVKALVKTMHEYRVDASLLEAVEAVNEAQKRRPLQAILDRFGPDLRGKRIAVWGLAFKPETDDMRDAPALVVVKGLLDAGAEVQAHDPQAMEQARFYIGDAVTYCSTSFDAAKNADALVILTEWQSYRRPDLQRLKVLMRQPIIVDGRNLFEPDRVAESGFEYVSIGRAAARPAPALAAR